MADNYTAKDASGATQSFRAKDNGTYLVPQSSQAPQPAASANKDTPTTNTAAVITKSAPGVGLFNVLAGVYWSYDLAPTGGNLQITDNGTVVFSLDIPAAGPGFLPFSPPLRNAAANEALVVTLHAGGSGVSGKLSAHAWVE